MELLVCGGLMITPEVTVKLSGIIRHLLDVGESKNWLVNLSDLMFMTNCFPKKVP
jgi:hypothetical protein